jgi:Domain of unknown function (DUF397)
MTTNHPAEFGRDSASTNGLEWRKSVRSNFNGNCVE